MIKKIKSFKRKNNIHNEFYKKCYEKKDIREKILNGKTKFMR
jgi:hypothetical protein